MSETTTPDPVPGWMAQLPAYVQTDEACGEHEGMKPDPIGAWVFYGDVLALLRQIAAQQEAREETFGAIARPGHAEPFQVAGLLMTSEDARIAQIQERAEKATKGPWVAKPGDFGNEDRCGGIAVEGAKSFYDEIVTTDSGYYGPKWPDAEFIAHAREDIPYLLDHVAALTHAREEAQQQLAEVHAILSPGGLVDASGNEVPTTVLERARMTVLCLSTEADLADEARRKYEDLNAGFEARVAHFERTETEFHERHIKCHEDLESALAEVARLREALHASARVICDYASHAEPRCLVIGQRCVCGLDRELKKINELVAPARPEEAK
jgi:hypothetical protein